MCARLGGIGRVASAGRHRPGGIGRVAPAGWHRPGGIGRVASAGWHRSGCIGRVASAGWHRPGGIGRVASAGWHRPGAPPNENPGYAVVSFNHPQWHEHQIKCMWHKIYSLCTFFTQQVDMNFCMFLCIFFSFHAHYAGMKFARYKHLGIQFNSK